MRSVALLGATGLVGRHVLSRLEADPSIGVIHVIGRREIHGVSQKVVQHVFDLSALDEDEDALAVDQVFCALGTTIAQAGSQESFRRVDHDYPLAAARIALRRGARHYLLVSALGASARSRVFYNRVKGELEDDVIALGYRSTTIVRPSLLLGERTERRRGEEIAKKLSWITPAKYRGIQAATVAEELAHAAQDDAPGVRIVESRAMRERWE